MEMEEKPEPEKVQMSAPILPPEAEPSTKIQAGEVVITGQVQTLIKHLLILRAAETAVSIQTGEAVIHQNQYQQDRELLLQNRLLQKAASRGKVLPLKVSQRLQSHQLQRAPLPEGGNLNGQSGHIQSIYNTWFSQ
jgi:hypothetical protein